MDTRNETVPSPLAAALNAAEEDAVGKPNSPEIDLLTTLLMCYHDFDASLSSMYYHLEGYEFFSMGVNRDKEGFFLHAQFLVGLP